jgi:glycosyltransferase involved in cell wall biosynthesis
VPTRTVILPKMEFNKLSVIVPIYKKEKTIRDDLKNIHKVLESTPYNFEIIGIVDGVNHDKSYDYAKQLELTLPQFKAYGYKENYGKGLAVRYGMSKASGDIVMFIDAGGDIKPEGIVMLLEHMKWYSADIIIGSKSHPASKVYYPFKRRVLSFGYFLLVKALFGLRVRDTQTGLKAYKREVLRKVLDRMVVKRFAFDIEILAVANKLGFKRIFDAPVEVNIDFKSSSIFGLFASNGIWGFVYDTIAIWYRMHILRYYDDGVKRLSVYDENLNMRIYTGGMEGKHQVILSYINTFFIRMCQVIFDE